MMGPLPTIYRWRLLVAALVVFSAAGGWVVASTPIPVLVEVGVMVGLLAGLLVGFLLLHDFSPRPAPARRR